MIVARIDIQAVAAFGAKRIDQTEISRRFFYPHNVRMICQYAIGFHRHRKSRTRGHVVENEGTCCRIRERTIMGDDPTRGGFVVVGGYGEKRIGTCFTGIGGKQDRVCGRVGAAARQKRHSAADLTLGKGDQLHVFCVGKRCTFSRRACHEKRADARLDLRFYELGKGGIIDLSIPKRRE